jgi:agmatine/peptidylarginine deiminase
MKILFLCLRKKVLAVSKIYCGEKIMHNQNVAAEWEPQSAMLLHWPHKNMNCNWVLAEFVQLYEALVSVMCDYANIVIVLPDAEIENVQARLEAMSVPLEYVYFYAADTRDLWASDYQFLGAEYVQKIKIAEVSNTHWQELENLCASHAHWRVDNLVRFAPNNTIVYTACDDEQDENYAALKKVEAELALMTNANAEPYRLLALPWPGEQYDDKDNKIAVSYAGFIVVNEAVLVPIFNALSDEDALDVISQAFPGFDIMGIPSVIVAEQGGSLHRLVVPLAESVFSFDAEQ